MPEWRSLTLAEVCRETGGSIQTGPFGSQLHASDYVIDGIPSVMPQNIADNRIDETDIARVSASDAERLSRHRLQPGDIVYSRRGDVERRALVREENAGWLCGTGCLRVRFGDQRVHEPSFISFALGTPWTRAWITRHAVGATMLNLNTAILGAVPVTVPRIQVQRAIAEVLSALDDKIAGNALAAEAVQKMMLAVARRATGRAALGSLATQRTTAIKPEAFDDWVDHYSLPAFDSGALPERVARDSVQSNKFLLRGASVLIAKLNPRIPRIWNIPALGGELSVASTEFVVLEPDDCSTSALWAAVSQPEFSTQLQGKVAGTSGSHQRVRPAEVLAVDVLDPRTLVATDRALLDDLGRSIALLRTESARLAATRDELLPLLMSGRIPVRDVEEVDALVTGVAAGSLAVPDTTTTLENR